jgi:hypothetical protein
MQGRQRGFVEISGPGGTETYETFTCGHCGGIVKVPPRATPEQLGGICKQCMSMTCVACTEKGGCDPLEAKLKRQEDRARFFKQVGV